MQQSTERKIQASLNSIYIIEVMEESEFGKGIRYHFSGDESAKQ